MTHFFQDLSHDLREKRLWPVAALLVVALVALPVVLSEKRKDPAPAPTASVAKPEALPTVEVSDDTLFSSNLRAFKSKDPFKPGKGSNEALSESSSQVIASLPGASQAGSATPAAAGGASAAGLSSSGGGDGDTGSSGSSAPSGGGTGGGGGGGSSPAPKSKKVSYSYVADVSFGRDGAERRYRGLQRLEMLPSTDSPLLVFLGATKSGGDAVFLVDSNLSQAGEGSCADRACSVLSLGPGSEHRFRDDKGREYVLVIDRIRRVRAGASSARASGASARVASGGHKSRDERARGLVSSLLADTETVTTAVASRTAGKGR
jgi:hypothetical protein